MGIMVESRARLILTILVINKTLGWGYACCHVTTKSSGCLGEKGKKIALVKEFKIVKAREEEMKKLEETLKADQPDSASLKVTRVESQTKEEKKPEELTPKKSIEPPVPDSNLEMPPPKTLLQSKINCYLCIYKLQGKISDKKPVIKSSSSSSSSSESESSDSSGSSSDSSENASRNEESSSSSENEEKPKLTKKGKTSKKMEDKEKDFNKKLEKKHEFSKNLEFERFHQ